MTAETSPQVGYLDYDHAIEQVVARCGDRNIPRWLVNAQALLLGSSDYTIHSGYRLNDQLLNDPEHLQRFTGANLWQQAALGAAMIRADDPTSGRRSHVVSIATPGDDRVIVTFSTGDRLDAQPMPGSSTVTWTHDTGPDAVAERMSWVGHDRFALKMVEVARTLRQVTTHFNPAAWLGLGYDKMHGTGPVGPTERTTTAVISGEHGWRPTLAGTGENTERRAFETRLFNAVADQAARWAAAEGVELTVERTHAPTTETLLHPALVATLARITITNTGHPDRNDGWTITHDDTTL